MRAARSATCVKAKVTALLSGGARSVPKMTLQIPPSVLESLATSTALRTSGSRGARTPSQRRSVPTFAAAAAAAAPAGATRSGPRAGAAAAAAAGATAAATAAVTVGAAAAGLGGVTALDAAPLGPLSAAHAPAQGYYSWGLGAGGRGAALPQLRGHGGMGAPLGLPLFYGGHVGIAPGPSLGLGSDLRSTEPGGLRSVGPYPLPTQVGAFPVVAGGSLSRPAARTSATAATVGSIPHAPLWPHGPSDSFGAVHGF